MHLRRVSEPVFTKVLSTTQSTVAAVHRKQKFPAVFLSGLWERKIAVAA